ncbi:hypothetical protein [uncultured Ruegeria sp.]|uniref:hypothetical protein n=1 Tax=uncultured Ruegeria sp. TaxID=259304 RepID=UPI00262FDF2F|nr:hypothetical protein [uncultured Ruegeria sp.]
MTQERELILNLADWIERRKDHLSPSYADHIIHTVRHYEAEIEALQSQLAKAREVKPLIWESDPHIQEEGSSESALTQFGRYFVKDSMWWGPQVIVSTGYGSNEVAKAAAQADYQRRYTAMSALTQQGDG